MDFARPLIRARLVQRYKRFLADASWRTAAIVTAHCANPGAMLGAERARRDDLARADRGPAPEARLRLAAGRARARAFRRHRHQGAEPGRGRGAAGGGDPGARRLCDGAARGALRRGQPHRLPADGPGAPAAYVEVKNVHLRRDGDWAEFPDCVTARGARHLREMAAMVGGRAPGGDALPGAAHRLRRFRVAEDLDPAYARAFAAARAAGVEAICPCHADHAARGMARAIYRSPHRAFNLESCVDRRWAFERARTSA